MALKKSTMRDMHLRGLPALGIIVGMHLWTLFATALGFLGGGKGPTIDGTFFLESHGERTEVSFNTWRWMGWLEIAGIVGWIIAAVSMLSIILLYSKRSTIFARATDYSIVVLIVFVLDMILILVAHLAGATT